MRNPFPVIQIVRRGFTLIEVLLVVVLLGIAGVLVIPSMSQVGVLRVQASVRTVVADITFLQSEAVAFQGRRAIWFGKVPRWDEAGGAWTFIDGNGYVMAEVTGPSLDLTANALPDPDRPERPLARNFDEPGYAGAALGDIDFNGGALLIFDELGGPVRDLDGPEPGDTGSITITGSGSVFRVNVEAFTGRVTVTKTQDALAGG